MTPLAFTLYAILRDRFRQLRATGDAGVTAELVVVTALLVAAAIAILVLFISRVTAKAESIQLGLG